MTATLYMFDGSNACLTATLALEASGVPYRVKRLLPVMHAVRVRGAGFGGSTVPALKLAGRKILGSRNICHALAEAAPGSGLLPIEPELLAAVLDAEQRGERMQNAVRRLIYINAARDSSAVRAMLEGTGYRRLPEPLLGLATRGVVKAAVKAHRAKPERVAKDLEIVRTTLAEVDRLVELGVLGGDRPTVADCQLAPNISALALVDGNGQIGIRGRPAWQVAEQLLPEYPLAASPILPDEWITELKRLS